MKISFDKSALAIAIAAVAASGAVFAQGSNGNSNSTTNVTDVQMVKNLSLAKNLSISSINGGVLVDGSITVDSASVAVIDDKQSASANQGENFLLKNSATAGDQVMSGATGNIGINMVSGDNNLQDNASAMTSLDTARNAGLIDAEVFVRQSTEGNQTLNHGVENTSSMGASAFAGASGNIGVNVATGNNNLQKNNMAISVGDGAVAEASVNTEQNVHNNITNNLPLAAVGAGMPGEVSGHIELRNVTFTATTPAAAGDPGGITGGRLTTSSNGDYKGIENGEFHGTISGNYTGNHNGTLGYDTIANVDLGGELTGQVPVWVLDSCGAACGDEVVVNTKNVSSLGGQAFMGASGNIGINMSAGTNNVQSNSLSMAVIPTPAAPQ